MTGPQLLGLDDKLDRPSLIIVHDQLALVADNDQYFLRVKLLDRTDDVREHRLA